MFSVSKVNFHCYNKAQTTNVMFWMFLQACKPWSIGWKFLNISSKTAFSIVKWSTLSDGPSSAQSSVKHWVIFNLWNMLYKPGKTFKIIKLKILKKLDDWDIEYIGTNFLIFFLDESVWYSACRRYKSSGATTSYENQRQIGGWSFSVVRHLPRVPARSEWLHCDWLLGSARSRQINGDVSSIWQPTCG